MRIVYFAHSLASCWNHGDAHFLRGVVSDLLLRGYEVAVFEPADGWSAANLVRDAGPSALRDYQRAYPMLSSRMYLADSLDLDWALRGADLVVVQGWTAPCLVKAIGRHHAVGGDYHLLFHDTHTHSAGAPQELARFDLSGYDGVLAIGDAIGDVYRREGWGKAVWTWHEAADTRVFHPMPDKTQTGDIVWIGNWGDDERTEELFEFFIRPVKELGLKAAAYGVRYPNHALKALADAGIEYGGWLPNYRVPEVLARHRMTVHIPRKSNANLPTIRQFEAMACGIPLISAPWQDSECLFGGAKDYLTVRDGDEMKAAMMRALSHPEEARERAAHALRTILARHTCKHRSVELLSIVQSLSRRHALAAR